MKLINSSVEILHYQKRDTSTPYTYLKGVCKDIEIAGRTCYKSEDKITEDSATKFVDMLIERGHGAMLEFGVIYLTTVSGRIIKYLSNKYSKVEAATIDNKQVIFITTNYRVLLQGDYKTWDEAVVNNYNKNWMDDLKWACNPTQYHAAITTTKFICDRGISHELVRHRVFSYAQESTRYCNYSKDKFNNELTFIIPSWVHNLKESTLEEIIKVYGNDYTEEECAKLNRYYSPDNYENDFIIYLLDCESLYKDLVKKWDDKIKDNRYKTSFRNNPLTPQEARSILPNCLKTEICVAGYDSDWKEWFKLRYNKNAHPDMQVLANKLHLCFYNARPNENNND